MIKVCGIDGCNQLISKPNKKTSTQYQIISPPVDIKLKPLLSCSHHLDHTALITQEGLLQVIGDNRDCRISGSLSKKIFKKLTNLPLKDDSGHPLYPISVVCGQFYTLLLVSTTPTLSDRKLAFFSEKTKSKTPIIASTGLHRPVSLFGGRSTAAAIDSEGGIFLLRSEEFGSSQVTVPRATLSDDDAAVSIACCLREYYAVGSSGKVYVSPSESFFGTSLEINFTIMSELNGISIKEVSGTQLHCLAVSFDGRVFGIGKNKSGELGLGKVSEFDKFTEIVSLNKYKIVSATAGTEHSLFLTNDGKILGCGVNSFGQLFINIDANSILYHPIETSITSGASLCIAGCQNSMVFIGESPPNCPNRPVCLNNQVKNNQIEQSLSTKSINQSGQKDVNSSGLPLEMNNANLLKEKEEEILKLQKENSILKSQLLKEKEDNEKVILELQKENSNLKSQQNQQGHNQEEPRVNFGIEFLDEETIKGLDKIEELGSGGGGKVFKVTKKEIYALKEMNVSKADTNSFKHFIFEYEIMNRLSHPNILKTHGIFMSDENHPPFILLEFCPNNLEQAIKGNLLSKEQIVFSIYQIAEGMKYIHWNKIIHRDLKPTNILISSEGTVKICDFGISKVMTVEEQTMTRGVGTQKYMAPEVMDEDENYDEKVDVYSFGVLIFFVLGGDVQKIKLKDIFQHKKPAIPETFTEFSRKLINRCWNLEPKDRPSFEAILDELAENHYKVVELTNSEIIAVEKLIAKHKSTLPSYGH